MAKNYKRVLVISDLHCGHHAGLTPPRYQQRPTGHPMLDKIAQTQDMGWQFFLSKVDEYAPYHATVVNADCIDGRGERSGGRELWSTDVKMQCDACIEILSTIRSKKIVMTYGTPYHTGTSTDYEDFIADGIGAEEISPHLYRSINGRVFDVKHKIAGSSTPYGSLTPLAKEIVWNRLHYAKGIYTQKADVLIRSHTHNCDLLYHDNCLGIITPALQSFHPVGTIYGSRQCVGGVDYGIIVLEVPTSGKIITFPEFIPVEQCQIEPTEL